MFPKEIRKSKKYSLNQTAKKIGIPTGKYWLYENFPSLMPVEVACRFAYIMEVSINDIFFTHNSILNRTKG